MLAVSAGPGRRGEATPNRPERSLATPTPSRTESTVRERTEGPRTAHFAPPRAHTAAMRGVRPAQRPRCRLARLPHGRRGVQRAARARVLLSGVRRARVRLVTGFNRTNLGAEQHDG